jgi:hypothetical protein
MDWRNRGHEVGRDVGEHLVNITASVTPTVHLAPVTPFLLLPPDAGSQRVTGYPAAPTILTEVTFEVRGLGHTCIVGANPHDIGYTATIRLSAYCLGISRMAWWTAA